MTTAHARAGAHRAAMALLTTRRCFSSAIDRSIPSLRAFVVERARDDVDSVERDIAVVDVSLASRKTLPSPLNTLRSRDWALLEHGVAGASFASAPASFVTRDGVLVARTGPTTTAIGRDRAFVFDARSSVAKRTAEKIARWKEDDGGKGQSLSTQDFPTFALECALTESSRYYEDKLFRLRRLAAHSIDEISEVLQLGSARAYAAPPFQKLPPIRRAVKELEEDVRQSLEALQAAATTPGLLPIPIEHGRTEVSLTAEEIEERDEAVTDVLSSHARRMAAVGGLIAELTSDLNSARELWELKLDGDRTRTVHMNLRATIIATSAAMASVPAALGGMNIPHGWEEAPVMLFWCISGGILCGSGAMWYMFLRRIEAAAKMTDLHASELVSLQFILNNMDSLENVFSGVTQNQHSVTKEALRDAMALDASRDIGTPSHDEILTTLFKVFDVDKSDRISKKEWRRS